MFKAHGKAFVLPDHLTFMLQKQKAIRPARIHAFGNMRFHAAKARIQSVPNILCAVLLIPLTLERTLHQLVRIAEYERECLMLHFFCLVISYEGGLALLL